MSALSPLNQSSPSLIRHHHPFFGGIWDAAGCYSAKPYEPLSNRFNKLHFQMSFPVLPPSTRSFIAVDEGLDRLIRVAPSEPSTEWTLPLEEKCRTLQLLPNGAILAVTDSGYMEVDINRGTIIRSVYLFSSGAISAQRLPNGHTFLGGINLDNARGVTFVQVDAENRPFRSVCFSGDYVRRSTLTPADTILFTCDSCVYEGDWSGRILREFTAPGFKHAWKAVRLDGDRTLISAGYGAFAVEFSKDSRILRRWECTASHSVVRPNFFGDFCQLYNGGLLICNWLGHGTDLGGTGYPLLEFSPDGELISGWQDAKRTSSLQTFVILD